MVEDRPQTGASYDDGKYTAEDLSFEEIYEAAKSDHDNLPKLREREEGWKLFAELLNDINGDVGGKLPNVKDSFDSPAGRVYQEQLGNAITDVTTMASAAEQNKKYTGEAIAEVERVWPKVKALKEEQDLDDQHRNELQAAKDPETGNDMYTQGMLDRLDEARTEFGTSNTQYADSTGHTIEPYEYEGPVWNGRKPTHDLDDYQHAYYPEGGSGANSGGGSGSNVGTYSSNGGNSTSGPDPSTSSPDPSTSGPELQNPGTGPTTPTTTAPTGPVGPTVPSGSGPGPVAPPIMGGQNTAPTGQGAGRSATPPSMRPTTGPNQSVKPTPGLGNQRPVNSTGRSIPSGAGGARNTGAPKNSMLPNQRQAAAGRNPVTGSMRGSNPGGRPASTGQPSSRIAGRGQAPTAGRGQTPTAGRSQTPAAGRGGTVRPNKGFEETVYRNTRAQRSTVPGVVRGARHSAAELASGQKSGPNPSRIGTAGKVIGARKNKGKQHSEPEYRRGSLTTSSVSKKDTRHTWTRSKPEQSTEPPSGSIALNRRAVAKPLSPEDEKRRQWQERRQRRREVIQGNKRETEPETDLFGGYEGRVVPGVIRSTPYPSRVDEREAGARFSTHGWEGKD